MWKYREESLFYKRSVSILLFYNIFVKNGYLWYDDSIIQLHEAVSKLVHTILINKVRHKSIINLLHITNRPFFNHHFYNLHFYWPKINTHLYLIAARTQRSCCFIVRRDNSSRLVGFIVRRDNSSRLVSICWCHSYYSS